MRYIGKLQIYTSQNSILKRIKPGGILKKILNFLTFNSLSEKVICETFTIDLILSKLAVVLDTLGIKNIIRFTLDNDDIYFDDENTENDLITVLDHYLMDTTTSYQSNCETASLAFEKKDDTFHTILDVIIRFIHVQGVPPIEITASSLEQVPDDGKQSVRFKEFVFSLEQNIRKYIPVREIETFFTSTDQSENEAGHERKEFSGLDRVQAIDKSKEKTEKFNAEKTMVINKDILFPLYGITLGVTTIDEIGKLGRKSTQLDDDGKPFKYYIVKDMNFWYEHEIINSIYITHTDPIPEKWKKAGFDWDKTYNEWLDVLKDLGCFISIVKQPAKIRHFSGEYDSFEADVRGVLETGYAMLNINLDFNYSTGTTIDSKDTLYSISIRAR